MHTLPYDGFVLAHRVVPTRQFSRSLRIRMRRDDLIHERCTRTHHADHKHWLHRIGGTTAHFGDSFLCMDTDQIVNEPRAHVPLVAVGDLLQRLVAPLVTLEGRLEVADVVEILANGKA